MHDRETLGEATGYKCLRPRRGSRRVTAKAVGRIVPLTFEESSQECPELSLLGLRLNAAVSPTAAEFLAADLWGLVFFK